MSCGVGHRHSLDLVLMRLCCRPKATALIQPLAWELPYTVGMTLKRQKTKTDRQKKKKTKKKQTDKKTQNKKLRYLLCITATLACS